MENQKELIQEELEQLNIFIRLLDEETKELENGNNPDNYASIISQKSDVIESLKRLQIKLEGVEREEETKELILKISEKSELNNEITKQIFKINSELLSKITGEGNKEYSKKGKYPNTQISRGITEV